MRTIRIAVAAFAAGVAFTLAMREVTAGDDKKPAEDKAQYVGDKVCQKCHFQQHKSWKKGAMAKAMKALAPTAEADDKALFDRKKAANIDPAKDYTADEKCVKCHTTGYGEPGGYPKVADLKTAEDAVRLAATMANVGCEACHGPGSLYVKYKEPIVTKDNEEKKETKFAWEDLAKYGLTKPDETVCARCHNDQAPMKPLEPFKFEDAKAKVHDHPKK